VSRPLGSTATPASSGFPATTGRSAGKTSQPVLNAFRFPPSARSLSPPVELSPQARTAAFDASPSHVPCKSRRPGSRRLYAGHHLASKRVSARLIPEDTPEPPVSMPSQSFDVSTAHAHPGLRQTERFWNVFLVPT
jgi:hypothetical protein